MAKLGETDSRWIVSHRSDGKNVDNWHWNEKNLFPWAKEKLQSLLKDVEVPTGNPDISLKIESTDSVDGDMIVCNRKGKTLFVFDVTVKLKWKGKVKVEGTEFSAKGTIVIEDISNTEDKWTTTVKIDEETPKNKILRTELQSKVGGVIDKIIDGVLEDMKKHNAPAEDTSEVRVISPAVPVLVNSKPASPASSPVQPTASSSKTSSLTQKVSFDIVPNVLYETFLDSNRMSAISGGPAKVENKVNGEFSLFDGTVQGTIVELVPGSKIVQKWRFKSWPEKHYSQVTYQFEAKGEKTLLTLSQTGIPASDFERTRSGWESYFWQRIRGLFGWNYSLKN